MHAKVHTGYNIVEAASSRNFQHPELVPAVRDTTMVPTMGKQITMSSASGM